VKNNDFFGLAKRALSPSLSPSLLLLHLLLSILFSFLYSSTDSGLVVTAVASK